MSFIIRASAAVFFTIAFVKAQVPTIIGGGYHIPFAVSAAPGQVMTFFVAGVGKRLTQEPLVASAPLPVSLAGIEVTLHQEVEPVKVSVPIIGAMLMDSCGLTRSALCNGTRIAALTVQIPFELSVAPGEVSQAILRVSEDGMTTGDFVITPVASNVHFMTSPNPIAWDVRLGAPRHASVFHIDGTAVSPGQPARAGETLIVYGYGFGRPQKAIKTGEAPQEANPVPTHGDLKFLALLPETSGAIDGTGPALGLYVSYVGVTPGAVGVYQINFKVPPVPSGIQRCGGVSATPWNFMVTYDDASSSSFAFCVEP
jgi:uncharacterized protein (TIGR03437 family)